jgi:arsenate reductase-like glutaredoxin family protein
MPKTIQWLYARKSCATCKKAAGWCETAGIQAKETVDATKVRYGPEDALKLLNGLSKIVAAKGKNIVTIELGKKRPADDEITAVLIGPTGNLRAPTAIVGKTLLVGFHEEAYQSVLG